MTNAHSGPLGADPGRFVFFWAHPRGSGYSVRQRPFPGGRLMKRWLFWFGLVAAFPLITVLEHVHIYADSNGDADLIIHHAKIVTVDAKFSTVQALAIKGERIVAV